MSTVTVGEFLKLIKDHLEQELLNDIISAGNFSLVADETTDMGQTELSFQCIFAM